MSAPDYSEPYVVGYTIGHRDGYEAGYAARDLEEQNAWAWMRQQIGQLSKGTDYATIADRRGEPERAKRQRQTLADRGVA